MPFDKVPLHCYYYRGKTEAVTFGCYSEQLFGKKMEIAQEKNRCCRLASFQKGF